MMRNMEIQLSAFILSSFNPFKQKSALCYDDESDERLQFKSSTTMKIGSARFYESSMDCMLVSGKLFSNTAALDSLQTFLISLTNFDKTIILRLKLGSLHPSVLLSGLVLLLEIFDVLL